MASNGPVNFPSTAWTMVTKAKDRDNPEYLAAINRCIEGYWRPVFCFMRAKGYPVQRSEDLTQDFFFKFLERDWIRLADPHRGRFRTFLLTILIRFLSDEGSKRAPRQKSFERHLTRVSDLIGNRDQSFEPPDCETPDQVFMKQWAKAVVANVQQSLKAWCEQKGHPDWYEIFSSVHFPPPEGPRITQEALARRLGLTRDQVRYGQNEADRRFGELLRAEVADQVGSEDEIDTEIRDLERLLEA